MFSVLNDVKKIGGFHLLSDGGVSLDFFFSFSNIPDSIFESGLIWGHARSFRIPKIRGGDIERSISYSSCQKERISCFLEETLTYYIWTTSDNHHCLDLTPK